MDTMVHSHEEGLYHNEGEETTATHDMQKPHKQCCILRARCKRMHNEYG